MTPIFIIFEGMLPRLLEKTIQKRLKSGKVVVLLGARQVGKTTLMERLFHAADVLWLNGDDADTRILLKEANVRKLQNIIGKHTIVVIDEAQRIPEIGLCAKIIHDRIKNVRLVLTGSSSFELRNQINESLTGRKAEFYLFPFSFEELCNARGLLDEKRMLEHRLVYGYYPEVVNNPDDAEQLIRELTDSYLYKDVIALEQIKKPEKLERLIQALALQVGSEVSFNELANHCSIDKETVERYIQMLERAFVIFRLPAYSKNVRNELKKARKIYFWDNGLRNAVIGQFASISKRLDTGALWENFLISERMKLNYYHNSKANSFFWRTTAQQEIDYVEEDGNEIMAWEFKWKSTRKVNLPLTFSKAYEPKSFEVIGVENPEAFLLK